MITSINSVFFVFLPFTFYLAKGQLGEIKENEIPCAGRIAALRNTHGSAYVYMLACSYDAVMDTCFCFDRLYDREKTFAAANEKCTEMGGHLANIESMEELDSLNVAAYELFQNGRFYIGLEKIDDKWMWLHPDGNKEAGELEWFPDLPPDLSLPYGVILREETEFEICGVFEADCEDFYYWPFSPDIVIPGIGDGGYGRKKRSFSFTRNGYEYDFVDYDEMLSILLESYDDYIFDDFLNAYGYTLDDLNLEAQLGQFFNTYKDELEYTLEKLYISQQTDPGTKYYDTAYRTRYVMGTDPETSDRKGFDYVRDYDALVNDMLENAGFTYDEFLYKYGSYALTWEELIELVKQHYEFKDQPSPIGFGTTSGTGIETSDTYTYKFICELPPDHETASMIFEYNDRGYSDDKYYYEDFDEYNNSSDEYYYEDFDEYNNSSDEYYYEDFDEYNNSSDEYYYEDFDEYNNSSDEYYYEDFDEYNNSSDEYYYEDFDEYNNNSSDKYYYEDFDEFNNSSDEHFYEDDGYYDYNPDAENDSGQEPKDYVEGFGYYIDDYSIEGRNSQEEQRNGAHAFGMGFGLITLITQINSLLGFSSLSV